MNHSKKIILALLALSFSILLTISFAFAQNSPVNVGTKYEGLDVNTSIFNNIKQNPPDVQVAVGPNHIFEMVNVKGEIRDKTGHFVETVSLDQLFGFKSTDSLTSPKILYDNSSGRWFASLEDAQNDTVGIAVSPGNDPTATNWHVYHVNYQTEQECPDQPKIGVSDDKFVVSTNDINFNHNGDCFAISVSKDGAEYFVFNKNLMLDGNFVFNDFFSNLDFAVSPVQSLSSTQTLYMVSDGSGASGSSIQLYKLTGQVPSVIVDKSSLSLNPHIVQPA